MKNIFEEYLHLEYCINLKENTKKKKETYHNYCSFTSHSESKIHTFYFLEFKSM